MFINSASSKIEKSNEQVVYDSRNPKTINKINENIVSKEQIDENKIKNIIEMYNKKRPVYCHILYDGDVIEGIPYYRLQNILKVYITDSESIDLDIDKISYISIIRF